MKRMVFVLASVALLAANRSMADEPAAQPSPDEAAIRKNVGAYVDAFNKHDSKTLASFWSPDAVYMNHLTGEEVSGRDNIAQQFASMFKALPNVKLSVKTESVQFISPNVAVEHGDSELTFLKAEPMKMPYSAVYIKRDGQWLLDRVTDEAREPANPHYENLKPLEWMIGRWVDKDQHVDVETECKWTKNRMFITRSFTVSVDDKLQMSGMQIVGWDPADKTIRSWTFDSDGGFATATWEQKKGQWYVSNHGVLGDGRKASMVNVIKKVDDNSFTWQTIARTAGGEMLPNVPEVLIVRE